MHFGIEKSAIVFEETASKGRKKWETGKSSAFWAMGTKRALVHKEQNSGINGSPRL